MSAVGPNVCVTVVREVRTQGAPLATWACDSSYSAQRYRLTSDGALTVHDGAMCVDVANPKAQGSAAVIWGCYASEATQHWTLTSRGELTNVQGLCLTIAYEDAQRARPLVLWPCNGGAAQKWTVATDTQRAPTAVVATDPGTAELPRTYLSTGMPTVTGRSIVVGADGDLQAALNAAQPGDEIVLPPGGTYVGYFTLPAKANAEGKWITVRSAALSSLPEGQRVSPANANRMPKIVSPIVMAAISTDPGAQGWRLSGLEITSTSPLGWAYAPVAFGTAGADQSSAAQVPSRLVLDRSYVHGSDSFRLQRCVILNSASSAVIDSWLADCHDRGGDSQAIVGWNGPGPFKIVNNHLEGAGEIVMFGGGDPSVPGLVPSDIEIRRNHFFRPLAWKGVWSVKNLLELKAGQRVLVEANVFENHWADAQNGFGFVWWSANQDGGCTWCLTSDVTFRSNVVRNTVSGFNLTATASYAAQSMRRVTITNNVVTGMAEQGGRAFQVNGNIQGLTIANNTAIGGNSDVLFVTPDQPLPTFIFRNNVTGGTYTLFADGGAQGATTLARLQIPAANVAGNVFANAYAGVVPPGNVSAASIAAVGFADYAGGDLRLSVASAFRGAGVGGSTPGADLTAVLSATSGVVQ